jgi:uncharacterized protein (TIGR02246 family)
MHVTDANAMSRTYVEALNAGDLEALLALYEPNVKYIIRSGKTLEGQAAIRELLERLVAMKGKMQIANDYCVVNGDIALVRGRWTFTTTGPDGKAIENHGRSAEVLHRGSDGLWRYLVDHPFGAD